MDNSIPEVQMTPRQLDRLAAQRYLYSQAKKVYLARMMLAVPVPLSWSIAMAIFPSLQVYAALWGMTVALVDVSALVTLHRSWKEQAAKIQDLFDCAVLQMPWAELKVGHRPDMETVAEAAEKYRRTHRDHAAFENWYPQAVRQIPLSLARLVCQRSNCRWDATMRRRYSIVVALTIGTLSFLVFVLDLLREISLEKFILAVLAPLMPTILWGIREYREQREAADRADRLKEYSEQLWDKALKGQLAQVQLENESRELQNAIYDHRRSSPVIFD
jgi:SMODS-associating 4TM effector domain